MISVQHLRSVSYLWKVDCIFDKSGYHSNIIFVCNNICILFYFYSTSMFLLIDGC